MQTIINHPPLSSDAFALQEAASRLASVMDLVSDAVLVIDSNGRVDAFNRAAEQLFDRMAADIVGHGAEILFDGGILPDVTVESCEILCRRYDGILVAVELSCDWVAGSGQSSRICVLRDISARKQVEQELRDSESRFRDLAGSASDWFWETDAEYCLTFVSERIANVLGVKPAAILGHSFFDIGLGDDDLDLADSHARQIADRTPFRDVAFHVGPRNGKDSRTIRISGIPIFDGDGGFVGYRGVGVDITREVAAETRAKMAKQHLADAIESLTDAIGVYDADDNLIICNRQYVQAFGGTIRIEPGVAFESVLRAGIEDGIFHLDGQTGPDWYETRMQRHRQASGEPFVIRMGDGRWFLSREHRTHNGDTVGVRTDITALKQREAELEELRQRYELILGSAGEGIIGLDRNGRITFANRTAGIILRQSPDQMIGDDFHAMVQPPDGIDGTMSQCGIAIRNAYLHGITDQVRDDVFWGVDGSSFHVEYQVAPMCQDGDLTGAVLVFRDATLRVLYEQGLANQQRDLERLVSERTAELQREVEVRNRTEAALRASRERLKGIADSLFEGVLVIDRHGQLAFANASARRLLGVEFMEGDLEGHHIDDLMHLRQQGRSVSFDQSPWQDVLNNCAVLRDDDAVFLTAAGACLSVAYACSPIGEEGSRRSVIISFRDIDNLKQAQREALQASRMASVGQLAAGIAHEINTPVQYVGDNLRFIGTSLTKLTNAIQAADDPELYQQTVQSIKLPYLLRELPVAITESLDGVAQIARIVLSMKEFSHPGTSAKTATDINRAIDSTLTVSHNSWKHVATVVTELDPDLPPVLCYAGEMNQVFLNLIINAAHAIEASGKPLLGTITIRTRRVGDDVKISVSDTGTGIPEAIMEKIFDPFFTTKGVGKGTGQGLAICRDVVVVKHGGQIEVGGAEGQGAVFTVRLPIDGAKTGEGADGS